MRTIQQIVDDIEFENDILFPVSRSVNNPIDLRWFIEQYPDIDMRELEDAVIEKFDNNECTVTTDEMKEVYLMLKNRELHPCGEFDKAKRFYLRDSELVDVRTPSARYPFSQMVSGRTSKFVKDIAHKYKCKSKEELISLFVRG